MTKEEFLKRLKTKLSILEESEVIDILEEYSEHIDEKIKSGTSESDAIKEFGNINELASDILSAYKVKGNYSGNALNDFVTDFVDSIKEIFNKIVKVLSHGDTRDIVKLVIYVGIVLLVAAVIRIPFEVLENLFDNAFDVLPSFLEEIFDVILALVINISYIIVAFLFVTKMLKEKFLDNFIVDTEVVKETETRKKPKNSNKKSDLIVEKQIERKIVYKNEKTFFDSIGDLFLIIIKIFASFILIPCVIGIVSSSIGLATIILFSIKYYFVLGPIIICLGLLMGSVWLTELLFRFIANKSGSFVKSFVSFVIALVLCGAGIGISFIEFTNMDYKNISDNVKILDTYYFNTSDYKKINCGSCKNIEKIINNTLKDDEYQIEVYGEAYLIPYYGQDTEQNGEIFIHYSIDENGIFKTMLKGIKSGKIYNYNDNYKNFSIKLIANEKTLNTIETSYNWN